MSPMHRAGMYAAKSIPPASGETGRAGVVPCASTTAAQQKNLGSMKTVFYQSITLIPFTLLPSFPCLKMSGRQSSCPSLISYNIPTRTFCGQELAFLWILLLVLTGVLFLKGPVQIQVLQKAFLPKLLISKLLEVCGPTFL